MSIKEEGYFIIVGIEGEAILTQPLLSDVTTSERSGWALTSQHLGITNHL